MGVRHGGKMPGLTSFKVQSGNAFGRSFYKKKRARIVSGVVKKRGQAQTLVGGKQVGREGRETNDLRESEYFQGIWADEHAGKAP